MLHELQVEAAAAGDRLDVWLERQLDGCSRSLVTRCIRDGLCRIDPGQAKPGYRLRGGEAVALEVPELEPLELVAEDIPLRVLYEDEHLIAVDKPPGMVVHPAIGHPRGTLMNAVLGRWNALQGGEPLRPGLIHRLDADTSGLILVARTPQVLEAVQREFRERRVVKRYLALVQGLPRADLLEHRGWLGRHPKDFRRRAVLPDGHPQAKEAHTGAVVRERHEAYSVLEVRLYTGRTHQIRVHLADLRHPVLADAVYGRGPTWPPGDPQPLGRQALHAWHLRLQLPWGRALVLTAPIPEDLRRWLANPELQPLD